MPRPAVLLVHADPDRRKPLARGLAALGYEVIPALDQAQGRRFAEELHPAVVVAPLELLPALPPGPSGRILLLLGERQEDGQDLPEDVVYLACAGLAAADLVHRVHVLLLGREVGVEADARLESLVGDLALLPFLELLRALHRAELSGRLVHAAGEVTLVGGQVTDAGAGPTRGVKAFCRLSHLDSGAVRVVPAAAGDEPPPGPGATSSGAGSGATGSGAPAAAGERAIGLDLTALIIRALEDKVHDPPDLGASLRLAIGPDFFARSFTPLEQEVIAAVPAAGQVGRLLDALPATDGEIVRTLRALQQGGVVTIEEPQGTVQVVTDSTCDLPADLVRAHRLQVVPLLVFFGDRVFHDGVDLAAREFYDKLEAGPVSPRTNPPPRGDFLKIYREAAARRDIFSLHLSEKLSQTVVTARAVTAESRQLLAASRPPGDPPLAVQVADSASISLGLGLQALFAARMARRGLDLAAVARRVDAMRNRLHLLFVVDTLEYLVRGGRIGKARALAGKVLGVKPILGVTDGEVVAVDRVRGGRAAHPRLVELFAQRVDPARPVVIAVGHAKAPIWADRLRALLAQRFIIAELLVSEIGPVVGTHAGPGAVGAALFQPTDEELPLVAPLAGGG